LILVDTSILNVDDYLPWRYARTKLLNKLGLPVLEAGSGEEALNLVKLHRPMLVLLDVNLPDMSGFEVCRRIKRNPETSSTTVVHISASNVLAQHQVQGLDSGADGYLVEPIEPEVLIATVNAYIRARRAEDALFKSTEELRWFSYRIAHDLREPLRTISVYAELIKNRLGEGAGEDTTKFLGFIGNATTKLRLFMDGLLEYAQASAVQNETSRIECEAMLARVVANLDALVQESGARISIDLLPVVSADMRLETVFQNLVSNAIKYRKPDVTPDIRISAKPMDGSWLFSVQDNGIGIEPEYRDSVFEIFRRLHGHDIPGNGLGLALSRKIVEAHGGKIWVDSERGEGSTFHFTLPASAAVAIGTGGAPT
jgi:two-component system sensor histidine kinase/response regulator